LIKREKYKEIVIERKNCHICNGLTNPADVAGGQYDCEEIGAWSRWQGNLDSDIMLVGQDWGDVASFIKYRGIDPMSGRTNKILKELLSSIGCHIKSIDEMNNEKGNIFLTNAILCLKEGGMQAKVKNMWINNCARIFLRQQIEIINPRVVIGFGEKAFMAILYSFGLQKTIFRWAVEADTGTLLPNGSMLFAVYHCSPTTININRDMESQLNDWKRIYKYLTINDV